MTKSMSRVTGSATNTATATIATAMTKISHSYRAWQVPALESKGAATRSFLFKHRDHVEKDHGDAYDSNSSSSSKSDSNSNGNDDEKYISVI